MECKWFVYLEDHHEGPFTVMEIQEQLAQGSLPVSCFVWADGMAEWKPMNEVPDFLSKSSSPTSVDEEAPQQNSQQIAMESLSRQLESVDASPKVDDGSKTDVTLKPENLRIRPTGTMIYSVLTLVGLGLLLGGYLEFIGEIPIFRRASDSISDWSRPMLNAASEHLSFLSQWISPISKIEDISNDEYEELQQAARTKLETHGPKFALALSNSDPLAPSFYVGSNLSDGAQFHLYVIGVPDTLLNQLSFGTQVDITISKKLGKSGVIRFADGKPISRGEYLVYLVPSEIQPAEVKPFIEQASSPSIKFPPELPVNSKIVGFKLYFLGGKKDATYQTRLTDFHEKLRARAMGEISESKQFMMTLASQLESSQSKFAELKKGKFTQRRQKEWEKFHTDWIKLEGELDQIFQKWTPEAIKNEYFYGALYTLLLSAGQSLNRLHELQHGYFMGGQDPKSYVTDLSSSETLVKEALEKLKVKLNQAEKLPPTPRGMPQREGI